MSFKDNDFIEAGLAGKIKMEQAPLGVTFIYNNLIGEESKRFVKQSVIDAYIKREEDSVAEAERELESMDERKKELQTRVKNRRDFSNLKREEQKDRKNSEGSGKKPKVGK